MIEPPISIAKFFATWLPALAVSASVDPAPRLSEAFIVPIGGISVPVITCLLGGLGIILSRPFARKSEAGLAWPLFLLVSAIMLIVVELWILESRPGWLFAFVVAIGLGFSGYSLIELIGSETQSFLKRVLGKATSSVGVAPDQQTKESEQ